MIKDDRYQHQHCLVKCFRWILWKSIYSIIAVFRILCFLIRGAKMFKQHDAEYHKFCELLGLHGRFSWLCHIWAIHMTLAEFRMKHYYTKEEVFEQCKE